MSKRILILSTVVLIVSLAGWYFWFGAPHDATEQAKTNVEITANAQEMTPSESSFTASDVVATTLPELPNEALSATAQLQQKMAELYRNTFPNGDMSRQKQMKIEDNWCIASVDLQPEEYEQYQEQIDEWLLSRGNIALSQPSNASVAMDVNPSTSVEQRNADFIAPYEELPARTLLQYASNNDLLAVSVIAQREDFNSDIKDQAAKQLLLLGDTAKGLSRLVMNELSQMERLTEDKSNKQAITNRFIKVLAMVEYGLRREDTSALQAFLIYADNAEALLKNSSPGDFISAQHSDVITKVADKMVSDINQAREQVNLPAIDMAKESSVVTRHFQGKLAFLLQRYHNTLAQSWFLESWQAEFVAQDDCMQRKIATSRFWQEQVPELQAQYHEKHHEKHREKYMEQHQAKPQEPQQAR